MSEPQTVQLLLNPNGVSEPAQRVVVIASQVVGTALRALARDDLSPPVMTGEHLGYQFNGLELSDQDRRETYENWILSKGFQDLARGVRETLEEAAFYLAVMKREPGLVSMARLQREFAEIRDAIGKMQFPKLLQDVNIGLSEPMAFDEEFLSLQKVRNCLEHRGGRVGPRDLDANGVMTLSFPRIAMFYYRGTLEVELKVGEVIDTHDPANQFATGQEIPIYVKRVTRSRTYALNDPVIITASDFYEIAMACHMFAADVASKLPTLPATT